MILRVHLGVGHPGAVGVVEPGMSAAIWQVGADQYGRMEFHVKQRALVVILGDSYRALEDG